jgi:uncharacterized protein
MDGRIQKIANEENFNKSEIHFSLWHGCYPERFELCMSVPKGGAEFCIWQRDNKGQETTMTHFHITLAAAGVLGLIYAALTIYVVRMRFVTKTMLGDGAGTPGAAEMLVAIRTHANFAEYVPLALILLGGIEVAGASHLLVEALAAALILARVLHPFGMLRAAPNRLRAFGAALTLGVLLVESVTALVLVVGR